MSEIATEPDTRPSIAETVKKYSESIEVEPHRSFPFKSATPDYQQEIIKTDIYKRHNATVLILFTVPIDTIIVNITANGSDGEVYCPKNKFASGVGAKKGFAFTPETILQPGDYCIGLEFSSAEEVEQLKNVELTLKHEQISNLMLSHMIFGIYRMLGFDPSHVLNLPIKTVNQAIPFYSNIQREISELKNELPEKILEKLTPSFEALNASLESHQLQNQLDLSSFQNDLSDMVTREKHVEKYQQDKSVSTESVSKKEYQNVKRERDLYFEKLKEAEDYIDELSALQKIGEYLKTVMK